jgi:glycosyltransferase involved in cell wall biosynthesis
VKILVLSNLYPPDFIGGYELACEQAVDALIARGHEVRVLTSVARRLVPPAPHVKRNFKLSNIYEFAWMKQLKPLVRHLIHTEAHQIHAHNVHTLLQTLQEWEPDVVYVYNVLGLGGLGIMGCLKYLRVPWVWQLGDVIPPYLCTPWTGFAPRLARFFERQLRGHFIAVSQRLLREIETMGVRLRGRVEILPNWIRGARPPGRTTFYRGGPLRIVSIGVLAEHKGTGLLIEAAGALVAAGYRDFSIDFYGETHDPSFPRQARRLGLDRWVNFKGVCSREELMGRLGQYNVLAFPTHAEEPFGMAPLEAAAYGCVPVVSANCGISEWLVQDVHCLKAERSPEGFSDVFRDIMDRRIDLEPLARRGAATAWNEFHVDAIIPRIEQVLEQAARQSRAGAGRADEAYHLATLAEHLTQIQVQEAS